MLKDLEQHHYLLLNGEKNHFHNPTFHISVISRIPLISFYPFLQLFSELTFLSTLSNAAHSKLEIILTSYVPTFLNTLKSLFRNIACLPCYCKWYFLQIVLPPNNINHYPSSLQWHFLHRSIWSSETKDICMFILSQFLYYLACIYNLLIAFLIHRLLQTR